MAITNDKYIEPSAIGNKLLSIIVITIMIFGLIYLYGKADTLTFDIFSRLKRGAYYLEASKMGPMLLIGSIGIISIMLVAFLMLFDRLKKSTAEFLGKVLVISGGVGIISGLVFWPILNHQLDKYNYHYCHFYSGSNIASPPVYVKSPEHCMATPRQNIDEILAWFDEQEAAGVRLTTRDVKQKVNELKAISGY